MSYELIVKAGALADIADAYTYYEQQQTGLGEQFLSVLQDRFSSLSEYPQYYSYIDNKQILRDVAVSKFPYVIIYGIINEQVRVYAIHPTHKRPRNIQPE